MDVGLPKQPVFQRWNHSESEEDPFQQESQNLEGSFFFSQDDQQYLNNRCVHYLRGCAIYCECCKFWFRCRQCHDESQRCESENLVAEDVTRVLCLTCRTEQNPSNNCIRCNLTFGKHYYCSKCKLYENDSTKNIYHCDECRICLIGKREEKYHCQKCNICISLRKKLTHKCTENSLDQSCPICLVNMKYSGKPCINFRQCSHWLHEKCWDEYRESSKSNKCVVCSKAIVKQDPRHIEEMDKIVQRGEQIMKRLPTNISEKRVDIYCKQCEQKTFQTPFNIVGQKCGSCGCYNTMLL